MFKKISDKIKQPEWVKLDPRWKKFDIYDRLLDGTFYDHLPFAFYDEVDPGRTKELVKLEDRRPSAQYRLPRMVARWSARKLFAGRHAPRIRHKDKKVKKAIEGLMGKIQFSRHMMEVVVRGSVGSAAATFRLDKDKTTAQITVWRARDCEPQFDDMGQLIVLRVRYITTGAALDAEGITGTWTADENYWFVRDYMPQREVTYVPVKKDDWNPAEGFKDKGENFVELKDETFEHGLGFVPGHWFINLSGGEGCDGACTWEDAIPNSIDLDYQLSQTGRGVRYNCAPQLVVKGDVVSNGPENALTRGPQYALFLAPDQKDQDGNVIGGAEANLLEMTGTGVKSALDYINALRNLALEQISASRKDTEKVKGELSGRAMEYMDEDSHDLVMELRSQYGEHGALPFLKKIMAALEPTFDTSTVSLQWPRVYQPTPTDIQAIIAALAQAIDPLGVAMNAPPAAPAPKGTPDKPAPAPEPPEPGEGPPEDFMLLTVEQARAYLNTNMDLGILDIDGDEPEDIDTGTPGAKEDNSESGSNAPQPDPNAGEGGGAKPTSLFGMNIGKPATVKA